jgi:hypothetical protein
MAPVETADPPAAAPPAPLLRGRARWASLGILLAAGGAAAALALSPIHGECGFRAVLGAPCPGCGMTRSILALARGDAAGSLRWHPLGIPVLAGAATAGILALREGWTGRPVFRRLADRRAPAAALALLAAFALVWIVRVVAVPAWSPDPIRPGSPMARLVR